MSTSLIVTIAAAVFLAVFVISGIFRGFLRIILATFSLVITLILAGTFAGPLAEFAEHKMSVGPSLSSSIESYIDTRMQTVSTAAADAQDALIESLPLTASMKNDLKAGNTVAGYVQEGVDGFSEYMASRLTTLIIRLLCYILLFIVIFLIIRLILRLTSVINHIPILGGINRIAGGVIGLAEGVLLLWIFCMVIMMLSGTDFGIACEKVIADSRFLTFIYEHNYLMELINAVTGLFGGKNGA